MYRNVAERLGRRNATGARVEQPVSCINTYGDDCDNWVDWAIVPAVGIWDCTHTECSKGRRCLEVAIGRAACLNPLWPWHGVTKPVL